MTEVAPPEAPHDCELCPRLVAYRTINETKFPTYFNAPVPSFGPSSARLLVVGMAPGLHGANATGRPFTGDGAGDFLYRALAEHGFSQGIYDRRNDDGLQLVGAMITNVVRCVPPQNKPTGVEATTCRPYHKSRIETLSSLRVILTLGKIAHDSTLRTLGIRLKDMPFGHGVDYGLPDGVRLMSSFHTSRYNTNTRKLTWEMFDDVVAKAKSYCRT